MSKIRRSSVCSSPRRNSSCENTNFNLNKSKLISHGDFLNRVKKSLYYGRARVSVPLSDYIADAFSDTHKTYSLNRLDYATIGKLRTTPCSLILAMIYLERLKDADPAYSKHITPTELFLVSMMVATKFYSGHDEDSSVNWAEYAKMTPDNLLSMELEFLSALNWRVYVSNEEFFDKVTSIERKLARKQGLTRGWFTYMELNSLMPSIKITKSFLHFSFIIGLSYTAFVATMIASVFLVSQIPGTYLHAANRKATVSDAIASINLSSTTTHSHSPITNDAVNSTTTATEAMTENHNDNHIHSQLIDTDYMQMATDLLDANQLDRLVDNRTNATTATDDNNSSNNNNVEIVSSTIGKFNWSVILMCLASGKLQYDHYTDPFAETVPTYTHTPITDFSGLNHHSPHSPPNTNTTISDSILFESDSGMFQNYFHEFKMKFV